MAILEELQRLGKTIIISSHILSELQNLCNRVAIIEKGRLVYCGDIEGVRNHLRSSCVIWVKVASDPEQARQLLLNHPQVKEATLENDQIKVLLNDHPSDHSFVAELLVRGGAKLVGLREEEIGLEEVFMRLTTGETQ
jgi:ABC-2 type transport system ATP-binding protein